MFSMVMDSVKLFVTGRLFANYTQVFLRGILATLLGAVILVGLGQFVSVALLAGLLCQFSIKTSNTGNRKWRRPPKNQLKKICHLC